MNWKDNLKNAVNSKKWGLAINLLEKIIIEEPENLDAYLNINYLLMNLLVEEDCNVNEESYYQELLNRYFSESYNKFFNNSEYLFYSGIIVHMSEWYLGLNIENANTMIKTAFNNEKENILYKWGYNTFLDMNDESRKQQAIIYAKEIINTPSIYESIKFKGFIGEYILDIIKYQINR